ncbi:Phr family secreted Rap phosphatase inhibitor [Bacillus thuringiensis]|uniref:Phr family secreted Rap phosphatase inhibitor n=1 Tax=Bacillus thuringiensis TaxID=1428 RepID=UPI0005CE57A1|nr:Phr family secreted Rap phosphatase inhibitor [Bacillus thuringiensis]
MKKLKVIALGLSCVGILSFGVNTNSSHGYAYGDYPAPQRPDLAYSHGHTGGSPAENRGDTWSSSYTHGEPWGVADGNTGSTTYDHGRPPAPQA